MDIQEGFHKHKLLQEEHETQQEQTTQYTHPVNIYMSSQIKLTEDKTTVDRVNLQQTQVSNDGKQDGQIQLTIKQQYGEQRLIGFSDELKQLSMVELKQRAFPEQYGQGYKIVFIKNGIIIDDQHANPILHVQIYPSIHHHTLQHQPQSQIFHTETQREQYFLLNENMCDDFIQFFLFGVCFFLGLFLSYIGVIIVSCISSSDCNKNGAIVGSIIGFILFIKLLTFCSTGDPCF